MHYEKEWQYMMSYDAIIATTKMLMQSDEKFKPNSVACISWRINCDMDDVNIDGCRKSLWLTEKINVNYREKRSARLK